MMVESEVRHLFRVLARRYLGAVVVLVAAMRQGATPRRVRKRQSTSTIVSRSQT
jgi:hypothetical protein